MWNPLFIWCVILGEYFVSLIAQHRLASVPLLYKPLLQSETQHWHPRVRILAKNVLKLLESMDEHLFRKQEEGVGSEKEKEKETYRRR